MLTPSINRNEGQRGPPRERGASNSVRTHCKTSYIAMGRSETSKVRLINRNVRPTWNLFRERHQGKHACVVDKVLESPKNRTLKCDARYPGRIVHHRTSPQTTSTRSSILIPGPFSQHRITKPKPEQRLGSESDVSDRPVMWFDRGGLLGV
jgi:hypothetical protein